VIGALARLLVGSHEAQHWAQFVSRELRDPGPAFEILYSNRWRPGAELTARLIARILGSPESDPTPRLQALLLISGLPAFRSGRRISLRAMNWSRIGHKELAMVQIRSGRTDRRDWPRSLIQRVGRNRECGREHKSLTRRLVFCALHNFPNAFSSIRKSKQFNSRTTIGFEMK
jgi:hypothetical protein